MKSQELTVSEKIILAEKLWDSVANNDSTIELSEAQERELDKRIESYSVNKDKGSSWSEVKNRIIGNQ
ncbi:MAG: addiction module protein [Gammaproteobacteria bacterium]|nr:MAG: addiction module protein [Gammaproteobacteria bacterium]